MTHYLAPTTMDSRMNALVRWLTDRGFSLAGAQTLTVIGRTSGAPQSIPVNPLVLDGVEYLVAVRGVTQWVRNARAAGVGELRRGRRSRRVALLEVPATERAAIIRRYLDKWGWEVGRFLPEGLGVDATEAQLAEHAEQIPVFVVSAA
ncbi:nitroreductase family deazaflavin-dependent oxidoreductase [Gordonia polyisoprenivorans]|uniref:nitroreductase family deazaflavin-dependent oxidoreductase n=1 Tax=Gordonia polyisoprenivorans TaxID=84595 RepID=UPI001AD74943|nr:nitroreductase family deazaflavin-dependent oxidoreductase [Gordonia polyisoprenivorans]QTI67553.1 nitroreductase family deazaflavin-dependent oxidoreductase [Gordonia polyisoprenivorans]